MARRVHTAEDFGIADWWKSIPPVSRTLGAIWMGTATALRLGLLPLQHLLLDATLVVQKGQIWRLVTNVGFLAGFSFHFVMRMVWHFVYSPVMERAMTEYNPGEFAFFVLFSVALFDVAGMVNPFGKMYFSASPLVFATMYLWSREFPTQNVSIYGLVNIKAFYLPWAMLAIGLLFGAGLDDLMPDLTGIAVGHLYYFLKTVYPIQTGQHILKCPLWLTRFMARFYTAKDPTPQARQQQQSQQGPNPDESTGGFRAFSGRARRLQD